jgi:hypothetical protein
MSVFFLFQIPSSMSFLICNEFTAAFVNCKVCLNSGLGITFYSRTTASAKGEKVQIDLRLNTKSV